jgi:D-galactarolactone cycloisomerase
MKITSAQSVVLNAEQPEPYWGSFIYSTQLSKKYSGDDLFGGGDLTSVYPPRTRHLGHYPSAMSTVVVKIETNDGVVGWGESKATLAPRAVKEIIDELLFPLVINQDPHDVVAIAEKMDGLMRLRGHIQGFMQEAISGVDIALWDLKGKVIGVPIWSLLGGRFSHRMRVYGSGVVGLPPGFSNADVESLKSLTEKIFRMGFRGVKIGLQGGVRNDIESVRTVREVAGNDKLIFADAGGLYDRLGAYKLLKELEKYDLGWLEAPVHFTDIETYIDLSRKSKIPVACDVIWSIPVITSILRRGGKVLFQPDVIKCGGITKMKKIADLVDAFGLPFAPHIAQGSAVEFAATFHTAISSPNFFISEYWYQPNLLGNDIIDKPIKLVDGALEVPDGPGLGVNIVEEKISKYKVS